RCSGWRRRISLGFEPSALACAAAFECDAVGPTCDGQVGMLPSSTHLPTSWRLAGRSSPADSASHTSARSLERRRCLHALAPRGNAPPTASQSTRRRERAPPLAYPTLRRIGLEPSEFSVR